MTIINLRWSLALPLLFFAISTASALPLKAADNVLDYGGSALSAAPMLNFAPYVEPAYFIQATICDPQVGDTIRDAEVVWRGGNGEDVPVVYLAYSATQGIVLSTEGTNITDLRSIGTDLNIFLTDAGPHLKTCLDRGSQLHSGFQFTFEKNADEILTQVKKLHAAHPEAVITVAGHSLGAALSSLLFAWLRCQMPQAPVSAVVMGLPRVGNVAYAASIDRLVDESHTYAHIVNDRDIVPHLPPRSLRKSDGGYWHPQGELFITKVNTDNSLQCPGQENVHCSDQYTLVQCSLADHVGNYFGVRIYASYAEAGEEGCSVVKRPLIRIPEAQVNLPLSKSPSPSP